MVSQALNANYSNGSDPDQRLARNLGWFSIGLGATEIFAPGVVARISGAPDSKRSAYGDSHLRRTRHRAGDRDLVVDASPGGLDVGAGGW